MLDLRQSDEEQAQMIHPPYDREQADSLRAQGEKIVTCFQCLVEKRTSPYWPYEMTEFGGAMIFCKEHFDDASLGKAPIGELPPI